MKQPAAARIIVCEPTPRWAVLLRRFAGDLMISEARSLALTDDLLQDHPTSCIAIAVDINNAANVLLRLSKWSREHPEYATAVLLDKPEPELEPGFREAGAQIVISSLFELPKLVRVARRHSEQDQTEKWLSEK